MTSSIAIIKLLAVASLSIRTECRTEWGNRGVGYLNRVRPHTEYNANAQTNSFNDLRDANSFRKSEIADTAYFGGANNSYTYNRESEFKSRRPEKTSYDNKPGRILHYNSPSFITSGFRDVNEFKREPSNQQNKRRNNYGDFGNTVHENKPISTYSNRVNNNGKKGGYQNEEKYPGTTSLYSNYDSSNRSESEYLREPEYSNQNNRDDTQGNRRKEKPQYEKYQQYEDSSYYSEGTGNLGDQRYGRGNGNPSRKSEKPQNYSNDQPIKNSNLLGKTVCGQDVPRRIIGGSNTDIDEFPWLALLQYWDVNQKISHDCGGVLIAKRYVLTAAHCTNGPAVTSRNLKLRKVRLGEWDVSTEKDCQGEVCSAPIQDIDVEEIIPHQGYKPKGKSQVHDIALIRLSTEANLNQYVQPICLPINIGREDYQGKTLTVSGWGRTSNARDSASNIKQKVELPIVNWDKCSQFYQSYYDGLKISKSQFCAGGEAGRDSCQGDSGGPLMTTERKNNEMHWYLIGVVSSGPAACGVEDRPSLYTNVTQYTDWILENVKN